jgi:riboflavin kinase/FMN adenylyltransferase
VKPRRVDGAQKLGAAPGTTLVAIGNFDGVHRGHQAVIAAAVAEARQRQLEPVVLTFHPHPAEVLGRGKVRVLTTLERKLELISRIDALLRLVVEPFTTELASHSPDAFARKLLVEQLGARVVLVGENFRFGRGRAGDLAVLTKLGNELGFEARTQELCGDAGGVISSTRIREAVANGDLPAAESMLGRPHALSGRVVAGDRRGRDLGFPTANLDGVRELLPPDGVYTCLVDALGANASARVLGSGVCNLGTRPTVDGRRYVIEAHVFDFEGDLYGTELRLHLDRRLREERRFDGLEALRAQIARDVAAAREALADRSPDPAAGGAWF